MRGLETLTVSGAPHDCLRIVYAGNDKLFLPVENIEMLSRFGSDAAGAQLDRLGGAGWQARRARVKKRLKDMAEELLKIAAARETKDVEPFAPPTGLYDEFAARFPYPETEDQQRSIEQVLDDLNIGRPMDRLVCGDVGFGKTEVALRAAFVVAMAGHQVAVVVPTTLLARQHYQTLTERFRGLPLRIAQLSRMVGSAEAKLVHQGLADGSIDIVVGTHALLAKSLRFKRLNLIVVDEEQHFGVRQKERLKQLRADIHVLTLTATPIPRTLQMALSGVRQLSLIATPPVDRLAVRTFVLPFDPVIVREAIMREHFRGGQTYYICPRIEDLEKVAEQLQGAGAGDQGRLRPRPDARPGAGRRHVGVLRGPLRRAAVHIDRRIRARRALGQHHGHPPRRHVRPGAALPATRPDRALEAARICLSDLCAGQGAHRNGADSACM